MKIVRGKDGNAVQILTEAIYQENQILVVYQELQEPFSVFALEKEAFESWIGDGVLPESRDGGETAQPGTQTPLQRQKKEERWRESSMIEEFLDAETYEKKIRILTKYEDEISEEAMELLALTMDATLEGNTREMCYYSLMQILRARARFEVDR